jgi:hypothetical protein
MALGELQLKPDEFWTMTTGELMAVLRGFIMRRDIDSANHRNLFTLMANLHRKKGAPAKEPKDLWPLDIDIVDPISMDERLKFYKNIGKIGKNG